MVISHQEYKTRIMCHHAADIQEKEHQDYVLQAVTVDYCWKHEAYSLKYSFH
jgi:hypothetical protein